VSKENKNTFINKVNTYYDNNSTLFLKLGVDKSHFNIHQPLWPSTVKNQSEAANFSNLQIAHIIENLEKPNLNIVDLGCGVGGSLMFLQQYFNKETFNFNGLTLSQKQVDIAEQVFNETNSTIQIQQGNFQKSSQYFTNVDVVYMIEAFVHSPDYQKLIEQVSKSLAPGGLFIIVDDWLNISPSQRNETKWINQYKNNWLIGSLVNTNQLEKTCKQNRLSLAQCHNFTSFIRTDLRNRLLRFVNLPLTLLPFYSTYINSVIGGIARHYCLKRNWINYKMMVFKKG